MGEQKTFAVIGVGGYVAKKHLDAIAHVGGKLVLACDLVSSVGILDSYNKECIFTRFPSEFFYIMCSIKPDYAVICTPNYKHSLHTVASLTAGAKAVICEKPVTIGYDSFMKMAQAEELGRIYPVLNLRHNQRAVSYLKYLKQSTEDHNFTHNGRIIYNTPRGNWYQSSWKSRDEESGGLIFNIGIHILDLLCTCLGNITCVNVLHGDHKSIGVNLEFERVRFTLDLSVDPSVIPHRRIDGVDLNDRFRENSHHDVYKHILTCDGFSLSSVCPSISLACEINNQIERGKK